MNTLKSKVSQNMSFTKVREEFKGIERVPEARTRNFQLDR
jgi:hypothetical protein